MPLQACRVSAAVFAFMFRPYPLLPKASRVIPALVSSQRGSTLHRLCIGFDLKKRKKSFRIYCITALLPVNLFNIPALKD
jgi:hypothetical protein